MSEVSFSVAVRAFCPVERGGSGADPGPLVLITAQRAIAPGKANRIGEYWRLV